MLSETTLQIVKSTAPVLAEQGQAITELFYTKLFLNHPELKHIFNMNNQRDGEQSRALADSVFRYATHIDKLDQLGPMVNRIAHKHASLQVDPAHYPIVGKYLLKAIQEHLSLDSADPILTAWAEAYQQLAAIFVKTEAQIYQDNAEKPGGWRGLRPFVIQEIVSEAPDIKSFYLVSEDGQAIASFEPGQYLGVKIHAEGQEYSEIRQYSLSNAPGEKHYRITVKAESQHPDFPGQVSHYLHQAQPGDRLDLQAPTGDFSLRRQGPDLVLIAGGVGITPLMSILLHQINTRQDLSALTFIHCCRHAEYQIMKKELADLSKAHGFRYLVSYEEGMGADFRGYLTQDILEQWLPNQASDVYFCGPRPFMQNLNQILKTIGFPEDQLHYETFGPSLRL